ncbi:MAG: hypothetical protein GQ559_00100 [Desulfobulbaceae bacterium]|nr:hypothetical protein [Desulfobulbaceae bacterium]
MNRKSLLLIACAAFLIAPALAFAGQVEGVIQGLNCVTKGVSCPIDKKDPVVATEQTFVVLTSSGAHYLVPNLDRAIMARYITENVKISGKINEEYKSIKADALRVKQKEKWVTVWSQEMVEAWEKAYDSDI